MYEAQADTINVDDISRNSNNRIVLRRLQRNDVDDEIPTLRIDDEPDDDEDEEDWCYFPEGAYDMGWLGYFVGKSDHLQMLTIVPFTPTSRASARDVIEPFFRGVSNNKSIHCIKFDSMDMLGGEVFTMLGPFFKSNHNLINIDINSCDFGDEGGRLFALAIGNCTHGSLQKVQLENNNISEEGMVDIITALSMHPHLEYLDLDGNGLRKDGCVALGTLLRCSATKLRKLFISHNEINDDGIEALVPALATCSRLESMNICESPSITTRGWQRFATILESPNSNNLESISIASNNVDDEAVATFANALANNCRLKQLINPAISTRGWLAFSKVLCNTSSVNTTFLSNHTLWYMGVEVYENEETIGPLLHLNYRTNKNEVATIKILQNHNDFDMLPFFEWEFKVLPMALSWLERASEYQMPEGFEPNIEERKLSTIYQFVRGLPVLYVETRLRKELEDTKAELSQIEEEQLKFQQELHLLQERKESLEERKKSIVKKIGKPNFN